MGEARETSDTDRVRDDASRTRMNVGAIVPPPPETEPEQTGEHAAPNAVLPAASSTMLFLKGSARPATDPAPDGTSPPSPREHTPSRGPKRKQLSTTRPAWISSALDGDGAPAVPTTQVHLGPGTRVPGTRYKITRWLGDGGMGVVYEAEHVDLGRKAALKVLRAELCRNPEAVGMFREEARAASRLGHDNIVDVFDFAELPDGRLLFAMEMLEGPSLSDVIKASTLEVPRAVAILRQICKGLAVAHDAGIIHRDVKPDNLALESERGRDDVVKILDFGIATIAGESAQGPISAGSPYYLAPELVAGLPFDHRVDIYALGCTAYEMLSGSPPIMGDTIQDVLRAHLEQEPTPISRVVPEVPRALEAVIARCLAKDPDARFPNMAELEAALCEAQIEAGFHTTWDDLSLPQLTDPDRQARLAEAMPNPGSTMVMVRPRSRLVLAAAAFVLLAAGAGLAYSLTPETAVAVSQVDSEVAKLVRAARAEAALHYYVYPPKDEPERDTAYSIVRKLETLEKGGKPAADLRREFATTLVRLGDRYWDSPGGKTFAIDYYAQALVFEPENERAAQRGTLTPGQLAALQDKAERGEFSEGELAAAEPLAALAEEDEALRDEKLQALDEAGGVGAAGTEASLEKLTGRKARRRRAVAPAPEPEPETTEDRESRSSGKRAGAAELVTQAQAAATAGKRGEARKLFERALARDRKNPQALIGLSDLEFSAGNYQQAVRYAERAVKAAPRKGSYQIKLGDAYYKVMRYEDAQGAYQAAGKLGEARAERRLERVGRKLAG